MNTDDSFMKSIDKAFDEIRKFEKLSVKELTPETEQEINQYEKSIQDTDIVTKGCMRIGDTDLFSNVPYLLDMDKFNDFCKNNFNLCEREYSTQSVYFNVRVYTDVCHYNTYWGTVFKYLLKFTLDVDVIEDPGSEDFDPEYDNCESFTLGSFDSKDRFCEFMRELRSCVTGIDKERASSDMSNMLRDMGDQIRKYITLDEIEAAFDGRQPLPGEVINLSRQEISRIENEIHNNNIIKSNETV